MPLSRTRDYLSIGEVLEAVKADFPDVSISKIRFLETEGLLTPERTPSGYRKFYDYDVKRLRNILSLQRDHFMPLKVIKDRLAAGGEIEVPALQPPPPTAGVATNGASEPAVQAIETDVSLDRAGLSTAAGLAPDQLSSLIEFGLIADKADGPYDGIDLQAAQAAETLLGYGLEARHLRMYRQMADREAGLFEQVVSPTAKRGDPSAPERVADALDQLVKGSTKLRAALLRATLSGSR